MLSWLCVHCNRGRLRSVRHCLVSHLCRCIVQRLCVTDFMHPCIPTLFDHLYASLHKAFGRSVSASLPKPQTPSPWEGAILLGLPPLVQARMLAVSHTKPLHDAVAQMADDLYGGYAPKQGCFGCLSKVLHDAKPAERATLNAHF